MAELRSPLLFTSITTAVGFGALALVPIPPVRVFGIFVAVAIPGITTIQINDNPVRWFRSDHAEPLSRRRVRCPCAACFLWRASSGIELQCRCHRRGIHAAVLVHPRALCGGWRLSSVDPAAQLVVDGSGVACPRVASAAEAVLPKRAPLIRSRLSSLWCRSSRAIRRNMSLTDSNEP
ncbi:MAG: putative exporter [Candidatus Poriferisodalaceae bacterium]|jgi:predicted exporter